MLPKDEQKLKNELFWGNFKTQMKKNMSSTGRRINWLNYPTETKELYLRMQATGKSCSVSFDIQSKDKGVREVIWEQMGELKMVLLSEMIEEGEWIESLELPNGMEISRITWERNDLNYYNESDVLEIYAFFESKLKAFDRFYQEYKDILIQLLD